MPRGLEATSFHRGSFLSMGMGPARGMAAGRVGNMGLTGIGATAALGLPSSHAKL